MATQAKLRATGRRLERQSERRKRRRMLARARRDLTRLSKNHCRQCGAIKPGCGCVQCRAGRGRYVYDHGEMPDEEKNPPYPEVGQEFWCTSCRRWVCWCRGADDRHGRWCDDCVARCRCAACKEDRRRA